MASLAAKFWRLIWGEEVFDAPTPLARVPLSASSAVPPLPPRPPARRTALTPPPPHAPRPPHRRKEVPWLTSQLSDACRKQAASELRDLLAWRALGSRPLAPPKQPAAYTRFGLRGEQLCPYTEQAVCEQVCAELRESVRTVEGPLSWSERNWKLAMHSARLGQLCADLERRGFDALAVLRAGLDPLWS